jgi:hypothetical protein
VIGGLRKVHNEELHNFYLSPPPPPPNIIRWSNKGETARQEM